MKRILIIPATAALLTGLSATAQDFNDSADTVKTPAPVLYTDDTTDGAAALDEMTVDELNALQLQRLQVSPAAEAGTGDALFQVETATGMERNATDEVDAMNSDADPQALPSDTMESEAGAPVEADTEMNAQGDAQDHATMPTPDMMDATPEQDDPVMQNKMEPGADSPES